eukprot:Clim_evm12s156 gene=Clim_evmTU12s156
MVRVRTETVSRLSPITIALPDGTTSIIRGSPQWDFGTLQEKVCLHRHLKSDQHILMPQGENWTKVHPEIVLGAYYPKQCSSLKLVVHPDFQTDLVTFNFPNGFSTKQWAQLHKSLRQILNDVLDRKGRNGSHFTISLDGAGTETFDMDTILRDIKTRDFRLVPLEASKNEVMIEVRLGAGESAMIVGCAEWTVKELFDYIENLTAGLVNANAYDLTIDNVHSQWNLTSEIGKIGLRRVTATKKSHLQDPVCSDEPSNHRLYHLAVRALLAKQSVYMPSTVSNLLLDLEEDRQGALSLARKVLGDDDVELEREITTFEERHEENVSWQSIFKSMNSVISQELQSNYEDPSVYYDKCKSILERVYREMSATRQGGFLHARIIKLEGIQTRADVAMPDLYVTLESGTLHYETPLGSDVIDYTFGEEFVMDINQLDSVLRIEVRNMNDKTIARGIARVEDFEHNYEVEKTYHLPLIAEIPGFKVGGIQLKLSGWTVRPEPYEIPRALEKWLKMRTLENRVCFGSGSVPKCNLSLALVTSQITQSTHDRKSLYVSVRVRDEVQTSRVLESRTVRDDKKIEAKWLQQLDPFGLRSWEDEIVINVMQKASSNKDSDWCAVATTSFMAWEALLGKCIAGWKLDMINPDSLKSMGHMVVDCQIQTNEIRRSMASSSAPVSRDSSPMRASMAFSRELSVRGSLLGEVVHQDIQKEEIFDMLRVERAILSYQITLNPVRIMLDPGMKVRKDEIYALYIQHENDLNELLRLTLDEHGAYLQTSNQKDMILDVLFDCNPLKFVVVARDGNTNEERILSRESFEASKMLDGEVSNMAQELKDNLYMQGVGHMQLGGSIKWPESIAAHGRFADASIEDSVINEYSILKIGPNRTVVKWPTYTGKHHLDNLPFQKTPEAFTRYMEMLGYDCGTSLNGRVYVSFSSDVDDCVYGDCIVFIDIRYVIIIPKKPSAGRVTIMKAKDVYMSAIREDTATLKYVIDGFTCATIMVTAPVKDLEQIDNQLTVKCDDDLEFDLRPLALWSTHVSTLHCGGSGAVVHKHHELEAPQGGVTIGVHPTSNIWLGESRVRVSQLQMALRAEGNGTTSSRDTLMNFAHLLNSAASLILSTMQEELSNVLEPAKHDPLADLSQIADALITAEASRRKTGSGMNCRLLSRESLLILEAYRQHHRLDQAELLEAVLLSYGGAQSNGTVDHKLIRDLIHRWQYWSEKMSRVLGHENQDVVCQVFNAVHRKIRDEIRTLHQTFAADPMSLYDSLKLLQFIESMPEYEIWLFAEPERITNTYKRSSIPGLSVELQGLLRENFNLIGKTHFSKVMRKRGDLSVADVTLPMVNFAKSLIADVKIYNPLLQPFCNYLDLKMSVILDRVDEKIIRRILDIENVDGTGFFEAFYLMRGIIDESENSNFPCPNARSALCRLYRPFVTARLERSRRRMGSMVQLALSQDNLVPVTDDATESSSVTDIMAILSAHRDLVEEIEWPEQDMRAHMHFTMASITNLAIKEYTAQIASIISTKITKLGRLRESEASKVHDLHRCFTILNNLFVLHCRLGNMKKECEDRGIGHHAQGQRALGLYGDSVLHVESFLNNHAYVAIAEKISDPITKALANSIVEGKGNDAEENAFTAILNVIPVFGRNRADEVCNKSLARLHKSQSRLAMNRHGSDLSIDSTDGAEMEANGAAGRHAHKGKRKGNRGRAGTRIALSTVAQDKSPYNNPIMQHLETIMECMVGFLRETLFPSMISILWNRMLLQFETRCLPSSGSKGAQKVVLKKLSNQEIHGIQTVFEDTVFIFHGDGEGIPMEELRTQRFLNITRTLQSILTPTQELVETYFELRDRAPGRAEFCLRVLAARTKDKEAQVFHADAQKMAPSDLFVKYHLSSPT